MRDKGRLLFVRVSLYRDLDVTFDSQARDVGSDWKARKSQRPRYLEIFEFQNSVVELDDFMNQVAV